MSTPLPRHRDMPVSYSAPAGVFCAAHYANTQAYLFKTKDTQQAIAPYSANGKWWISSDNKRVISWDNNYSSTGRLLAYRNSWFYHKGLSYPFDRKDTHFILCACMPSAVKLVTVEMGWNTDELSICEYTVSSEFALTRTSSRVFHNAGKTLSSSNSFFFRMTFIGDHFYSYGQSFPALFLTDCLTLFFLDYDATATYTELKKIVFSADYASETATVIPFSSGYGAELIGYKDTMIALCVTNVDSLTVSDHEKHLEYWNGTHFVQFGSHFLNDGNGAYRTDKHFIYGNKELDIEVWREDTNSAPDQYKLVVKYRHGLVTETILDDSYTASNVGAGIYIGYAAALRNCYSGKLIVIPIDIINDASSTTSWQKGLIINAQTFEYTLLDYPLEPMQDIYGSDRVTVTNKPIGI